MDNHHSLSMDEVFKNLESSESGISNGDYEKLLEKYGYNEFKEQKSKNFFQRFLEQFKDFLVVILIIAAVISGAVGEVADTIIILSIVILNALLGVIQESKAEESLKALKKMAAPIAHVIRNGISLELPARELVLGDVVVLEAGKYVPADLRLFEASNLKIEESSLTGESVPVDKNNILINDSNVPLGDRKNMAFMSSMVTYGRGKGVVIATGMNTEIGKIADMISKVEEESTPLQKNLAQVGKFLGIAALVICAVMFLVGVLEGRPVLGMFMTAVSLAVAAIPEGLTAVVTVVLAVETLGCAQVICSDKTGTLTQNKMTVKKIYTINGFTERIADAKRALYIANLCNDTQIIEENESYRTIGDPTETALIDIALQYGIDKRQLENEYKRVDEIPFDSDRKLMTTFNKSENGLTVNTKGAPDIMLSKVKYVYDGENIRKITQEDIMHINEANEEMASLALRVLAVGFKEIKEIDKTDAESELVFAGLLGMIDPPREEAKDAVGLCKTAGIKPVMITGDHKATAVAIAKELGILNNPSESISGPEIENMSQEELVQKVQNYSVYARVSPEHKVRIVEAWKSKGKIVAMTGDGVNDAPALKTANIGAAMGITGTDVAKEAADMVLTDDNFATIVSAVEEGRTIFSNIKKAIHFLLSCNAGEIVTLFVAILLNWHEPLLPIHILWVNLVTDSLPALALGMESAEKGVMNQPPRDPNRSIFAGGLALKIAIQGIIIGAATLGAFRYGVLVDDLTAGRSMAFFTLSLSQLVHSFNIRYEKKSVVFNRMFSNKYLNGAFLVSLMIQCAVLATPQIREIFKIRILSLDEIGIVILASLTPLVIVEIWKFITNIFKKNK